LLAGALLLAAALTASAVQAQTPITYYDPQTGSSVVIYPSAVQPGAYVPIPNSGQSWYDPNTGASGYRYLGIDGQWHGNATAYNPDGSTTTSYYGAHLNLGNGHNTVPHRLPSRAPHYTPVRPYRR
jgi:hypothetical protein